MRRRGLRLRKGRRSAGRQREELSHRSVRCRLPLLETRKLVKHLRHHRFKPVELLRELVNGSRHLPLEFGGFAGSQVALKSRPCLQPKRRESEAGDGDGMANRRYAVAVAD